MTARQPRAVKSGTVAFGEDELARPDADGSSETSPTPTLDEGRGVHHKRRQQSRGQVKATAAEQDDIMDQILFGDDTKGGEYLKGLISSNGLKTAVDKLLKRMVRIEEVTGSKKPRSAMSTEELDRAFATRKECRELAIEEYEGRLSAHEQRLMALEAASEAVLKRFKVNEKDVSEVHNELAQHWQTIGVAQQDIRRVEQQDNNHHEEALRFHQQLRTEIGEQEAASADARQVLVDRQEGEEKSRLGFVGMLQELRDFLYSAGLQKQLEKICSDMLGQYVSWQDMKAERDGIHRRAVDAATEPLENSIKQMQRVLEVNKENLDEKDNSINNDLIILGEKVASINQKFLDRIDDVVAQLNQRALDTRLSDVEKHLMARDEYHEIDFTDFKELQTKKIEESYDRIQELESSIFAHEHALEHWAEEIGNRSTKYDMMVLQNRVDKCAIKDKTDADYKEVQKTLKWQSVKLETLTFKSNFGGESGDAAPQSPRLRKSSVMGGEGGKRGSGRRAMKSATEPALEEESVSASEEVSGSRPSSTKPGAKTPDSLQRPGSRSSPAEQQKDNAANASGGGESPAKTTTVQGSTSAQAAASAAPLLPVSPRVQKSSAYPSTHYEGHHHQPDSEHMAMLQQQLESLVHCVLGLSHATLRTAICGLSREAKQHSEERLIFHINSLLYWIMHRAAPPEWDPMELTSLALKCMENSHEHKRKGRHFGEGSRRGSARGGHDDHDHQSGGEHSERSLKKTLSKVDTWASDHMLTSIHQHSEHLPREFSEHMRHATSGSLEDPHSPVHSTHRASERSDRERAERRQRGWVDRGGPNSSAGLDNTSGSNGMKATGSVNLKKTTSLMQPKRVPKAKAFATAPDGDALGLQVEGMRELVMDIFGDQEQLTEAKRGGATVPRSAPAPSPHSRQVSTACSHRESPDSVLPISRESLPQLTHGGSASAR